jgi:hypothetical protein
MNFKHKPAFAIPVVVGRFFSFNKSIIQLQLCLFCIFLLVVVNLFLVYSNYQLKCQLF